MVSASRLVAIVSPESAPIKRIIQDARERGRLRTAAEIVAMAQRVEVAKMLLDNYTYQDIATLTGVSSATISRVKRSLMYGADGYQRTLGKLLKQEEDVKKAKEQKKK